MRGDKARTRQLRCNRCMDIDHLQAQVRGALASVCDPEMGEGIVDLGLVERIDVDGDAGPGEVSVVLVPTSATCPMADMLLEDATDAAQRVLPQGWVARARLDFGIPWSPARMSPALQRRFGWTADESA